MMKIDGNLPMSTAVKISLLLASMLSVSGCRYVTGDTGFFRDRAGRYTDAMILPPMQIPAELDSYTIDQLYVIPELVADGRSAFEDIPLPKALETRRSEGVVIQALGNKRWIVIDATPGQVWPLIRDYWTGLQIYLDYENPSSGIMETAWVEVDNDEIKRHKYRVTIEPGLHSGNSEVYVTHYENERTDEIPIIIPWPEVSDSLDLEKEVGDSISQYLADRNDIYQASSSSLLAGSIEAASKASIIADAQGATSLQLRTDYNRAWVIVRQALENASIDITDSNRDQSFYNVRFSGIVEQEDKPGFVGRLFRRGGNADSDEELSYAIRLLEENNVINVTTEILESSANSGTDGKGAELLQAILENLS
ncbi:MAG: outer membrane protein assembly factor BamC [Pseudohongiellaceae bacterium]|jgi:outer membrane protein assembly factor BamC